MWVAGSVAQCQLRESSTDKFVHTLSPLFPMNLMSLEMASTDPTERVDFISSNIRIILYNLIIALIIFQILGIFLIFLSICVLDLVIEINCQTSWV